MQAYHQVFRCGELKKRLDKIIYIFTQLNIHYNLVNGQEHVSEDFSPNFLM